MQNKFPSYCLLIIIALFAATDSLACSCAPFSDDLQTAVALAYERADVVFLGKAGSKRYQQGSIAGSHETVFNVEDSWKGLTRDGIRVRTNNSGAACGFRFNKRTRYLVFAYKTKDKILSTTICDLTQPASQAKDEMEILDELTGRKQGSVKQP